MRRLSIIGIGAGDPEYVTVQAINAMNRTDVFFFLDKGASKEELLALRHEICERYISHDRYRIVEVPDAERNLDVPAYVDAVSDWRDQRAELYERLLSSELADGQRGAFLAWGDPSLYDGTLRILDAVRAGGRVDFELDVVPGISAVQALAARHQIPLNQIGGPVLVTTARKLVESWSDGAADVVVMLDTSCAFKELDDWETSIYWGAYLGTPEEILISGTIAECGEEIERAHADARARKGWIFETYLLRRTRAQ